MVLINLLHELLRINKIGTEIFTIERGYFSFLSMLVENQRQVFNGFGRRRGNSLFTKIFSYWALLLKLYELDYYGVGGNSSPVVFDFMLVTEMFCFYLGGVWIWIESSCKKHHHSLSISSSLLCLMCVFTDLDSLFSPLVIFLLTTYYRFLAYIHGSCQLLAFSFFLFFSFGVCVGEVLFVFYWRLKTCFLNRRLASLFSCTCYCCWLYLFGLLCVLLRVL